MRSVLVAIAVGVSVIGVSAASLATAGPASADPNDQNFLAVLAANGLSCSQVSFDCTRGDDNVIQVGHSICRQMHGGNSKLSIQRQIMRSKPELQPVQAVVLVTAAEAAYCPE